MGSNRSSTYLGGDPLMAQKYTKAKAAANKKWDEENRERKRYITKRSTARNFIKKTATESDLRELLTLINERLDAKK